ncbi:hypothetical protein BDW74DRAFT_32855 [Aspergillus multicolor]|uniref:uncharacterized protein n=1 Tax=Aspergillus multicolor TaxID=41759 RepID=UPI003CCCF955
MAWSIESILALGRLVITIPTSIVGIWAIVKCCANCRYRRRRRSPNLEAELLPMTYSPRQPSARTELSPNSSSDVPLMHTTYAGSCHYSCALHHGSLDVCHGVH